MSDDNWKMERLLRARERETIPAMIARYREYGQPIDVAGYITGEPVIDAAERTARAEPSRLNNWGRL